MSYARDRRGDAFLGVLAFVALAACGGDSDSAPAPPAPPSAEAIPPPVEVPADAPTVLVLGDSVGAGLYLPEHQAFPAVLQRRLAAAGHPFHLINASESGRTTSGGVSALDWVLTRDPDVVVLALGANDGLRGVPLGEVESNLRTMIERAQAAGARVLLLGVRLPESFGKYGDDLGDLYPALAAETNVALVPSFMAQVGLLPEFTLSDGLHPNARGHERIAETVESALAQVLDEVVAAGE